MAARDDYDTALSAAATAFAASDYTEARKQIDVAAIHLARLEDSATVEGAAFKQRAVSELRDLRQTVNDAEARANKFEVHSQWVP